VAATPLIILDLEITGLAAEVLFNGVAVHRSADRETVSSGSRLNGWVQSGANSLQVRLATPPPAAAGDTPEPTFALRLRRATPGTDDEADQTLAQYRWTPAQPIGPALTAVFATSVELAAVQPWTWLRGYAFTGVGPGDRDAVISHLRRLRDALAERRIDDVVALQRVQVGEQAIAVGSPPGDMLGRYAAFLGDRMGSPDWRVAPLDGAGLRIELMAEGRVLHVTAADGGPPIVTDSADGRFAIDPYLSRIDSVWTVVR
jgi:hypothetical protein